MPFQIMIPSYLPKDFDRENVEIAVDQAGPGGEPMVQLAYRTEEGRQGHAPGMGAGQPGLEILNASQSHPDQVGPGLAPESGGATRRIWADVGPTRVSVYTADVAVVSDEQLLAIAETLGPASNKVVFSFDAQPEADPGTGGSAGL